MNLNDKKLTLEDGKGYIVIETVVYENRTFVYMVNAENGMDAMYREIEFGSELRTRTIDHNLFNTKILPLFLEKFEKYEDE